MIYGKIIVAVVAFLAASSTGASIDTYVSDQHNIEQCDTTKATLNLLGTNIYEPANFLWTVTRVVTYPENGINTNVITCLRIIDMDTNNHGGYPEIVSGGIGSTFVQIRLKSQWSQPLNFRIEIWAEDTSDDGGDDDNGGGGK